ncbi:HNH endonuclease [Phormidium sp. CCY1219]|uniref:HNH endonuclease n=1 Tax=Phormidium sp. CCY1219 TaxID=2886104 RepID=UPI002D1ECF22|nr:HNH endonuclease [Phormidium sp. CCY1219]MEB3831901.1 HNH endonuclease [Phormidium sp. CCY1219]
MYCKLCEREVNKLTVHHLIPKQKNGAKRPTIDICSPCHRQIHAFFDNARLARELNTVEKLQAEPQMKKFLAWVRKQKSDKRIKVHRRA